MELVLTDEQRMTVLNIFEAQSIRVEDYDSALAWKLVFDAVVADWPWRIKQRVGLDGLVNPANTSTIELDDTCARVLVVQLMLALKSGLSGRQVWNVIDVIERIKASNPDAVAV